MTVSIAPLLLSLMILTGEPTRAKRQFESRNTGSGVNAMFTHVDNFR
jgi:hypothetical protein